MNKIITHEDLDVVASVALLIKATGIKNVIFSDDFEKGQRKNTKRYYFKAFSIKHVNHLDPINKLF